MEQNEFENICLIISQGRDAIYANKENLKAALAIEYQYNGLTEQLKDIERLLATNHPAALCWMQNVGVEWDMAIMEDCLVKAKDGYYINDQFIENPEVAPADKVRIMQRFLDENPAGRQAFYYFAKMVNNPEIDAANRQLLAKQIVELGLTDGFALAGGILGKTAEELKDIYDRNVANKKQNDKPTISSDALQDDDQNAPQA